MPITCSGRLVAVPSFMIGIELVLLARIAESEPTCWSSARKISTFIASSSTTASTTSWRSARSPRSVVNASRPTAASRSASVSLPGAQAAVERLDRTAPGRPRQPTRRSRAPARRAPLGRTPRRSPSPSARTPPHQPVRSSRHSSVDDSAVSSRRLVASASDHSARLSRWRIPSRACRAASGSASRTPWARPTTGPVPTLPCSRASPTGSSCACSVTRPTTAARTRFGSTSPRSTATSGTCTSPMCVPDSTTAGASTALGTRSAGLWCNASKLLIDPYAKGIDGVVDWTPACFGYDVDDPDKPQPRRQRPARAVGGRHRSVLRLGHGPPTTHSDARHGHLRGPRARPDDAPPGVPEHLRGTYSAIAHPAIVEHLVKLGITAIELMPVHQFIHDHRLRELGLRNYWGYNSDRLPRAPQRLRQPLRRRSGARVQADGEVACTRRGSR